MAIELKPNKTAHERLMRRVRERRALLEELQRHRPTPAEELDAFVLDLFKPDLVLELTESELAGEPDDEELNGW